MLTPDVSRVFYMNSSATNKRGETNMKTALSVLKVNALSLLAFPLLVISMAIQLVQKALGKLLVYLGAGVALLLMAGLNAFINNPWAIIEGWAAVAVLAIFSVFSRCWWRC